MVLNCQKVAFRKRTDIMPHFSPGEGQQAYNHTVMGKLPAEGGGKGPGGCHGSRVGSRLGSRAVPTRGGMGLVSAATSLSTSDEKTRRNSRQHISKGGSVTPATPSLGESKEPFHAVKSLFKPYQVGGYLRSLVGLFSSCRVL